MLQSAIEAEVAEYIESHQGVVDEAGHRLVVRNGRMPLRRLQRGVGEIEIERPRVDDRREGGQFRSAILPPYMRRSPSLEALIPWLYLKGISTNNMAGALEPILGEGAWGLSAGTIVRLGA